MQRVANAFSMARIKNIYIVLYDLELDISDHEVKSDFAYGRRFGNKPRVCATTIESDFLITDVEFLRCILPVRRISIKAPLPSTLVLAF